MYFQRKLFLLIVWCGTVCLDWDGAEVYRFKLKICGDVADKDWKVLRLRLERNDEMVCLWNKLVRNVFLGLGGDMRAFWDTKLLLKSQKQNSIKKNKVFKSRFKLKGKSFWGHADNQAIQTICFHLYILS